MTSVIVGFHVAVFADPKKDCDTGLEQPLALVLWDSSELKVKAERNNHGLCFPGFSLRLCGETCLAPDKVVPLSIIITPGNTH
jgi:hypothetical protein